MATFDLYKEKPYWWFYYYLALGSASCRNTGEYKQLVEVLFDAVKYYDDYGDVIERVRMKQKYNVKTDTK